MKGAPVETRAALVEVVYKRHSDSHVGGHGEHEREYHKPQDFGDTGERLFDPYFGANGLWKGVELGIDCGRGEGAHR
jgi:hypothetical protein